MAGRTYLMSMAPRDFHEEAMFNAASFDCYDLAVANADDAAVFSELLRNFECQQVDERIIASAEKGQDASLALAAAYLAAGGFHDAVSHHDLGLPWIGNLEDLVDDGE